MARHCPDVRCPQHHSLLPPSPIRLPPLPPHTPHLARSRHIDTSVCGRHLSQVSCASSMTPWSQTGPGPGLNGPNYAGWGEYTTMAVYIDSNLVFLTEEVAEMGRKGWAGEATVCFGCCPHSAQPLYKHIITLTLRMPRVRDGCDFL